MFINFIWSKTPPQFSKHVNSPPFHPVEARAFFSDLLEEIQTNSAQNPAIRTNFVQKMARPGFRTKFENWPSDPDNFDNRHPDKKSAFPGPGLPQAFPAIIRGPVVLYSRLGHTGHQTDRSVGHGTVSK